MNDFKLPDLKIDYNNLMTVAKSIDKTAVSITNKLLEAKAFFMNPSVKAGITAALLSGGNSAIGLAVFGAVQFEKELAKVPNLSLHASKRMLSSAFKQSGALLGKTNEKKFEEKFPGLSADFTSEQKKQILKADSTINQIINNKDLDKINKSINDTLEKQVEDINKGKAEEKKTKFSYQTYVSANKLQKNTDALVWKDTERELNEIKKEIKAAHPDMDPITLSSEATIAYTKKNGGEPGFLYSKGINACTEQLEKSNLGKKFCDSKYNPAIHEAYVKLQNLEIDLGSARKMAKAIQDEESFAKLDAMHDEVRQARVELMEEFGVKVELSPKF